MRLWVSAAAAVVIAAAIACSSGTGGSRTLPTMPGTGGLTAPTPQTPINDAQLDTVRPTLIVENSTSKEEGAKTYDFQISETEDFTFPRISQTGIAEGSGTTSFTPAQDLLASARTYWRARARQGATISPWSTTATFRTKAGGFNRPGELFDLLSSGATIGTRVGSTTNMGARGMRIDNAESYIKYTLAQTLTAGEISVEVEGLGPNGSGSKARIFSMMDGGDILFNSNYLFNVQYRGQNGNPDNAISYKVLFGGSEFQFEPDFGARAAGVRSLNPTTTYLWTATWGNNSFRLTVREGGASGSVVYDRAISTSGTYNPTPHTVYLGANDAAFETGSYAGAIYRNLWVGNRARPTNLSAGK